MQVFVPFPSPFDVAKCLDRKRLLKQVTECGQILSAISGASKGWRRHPVTRMYAPYFEYLNAYHACLLSYAHEDMDSAIQWNDYSFLVRPPFLTDEFCDQHKRRLYTKAPDLYPQFAGYGTSEENWYVVDGNLLKYINGKQI